MTERRDALQHALVLPALCRVPGGAEFHAVTVELSAGGLRLRSAVIPPVGTGLVCNIRGVGAVEVRVAWASACEFAIRVTGREPAPVEVARRLMALSRQQARDAEVVRLHRRIVPARAAVAVTLADGTGVPATILNLSASGVALRLDTPLSVGQEIVVGGRRARVARRIAEGVGAAFLEPIEAGALGADARL